MPEVHEHVPPVWWANVQIKWVDLKHNILYWVNEGKCNTDDLVLCNFIGPVIYVHVILLILHRIKRNIYHI